MRNAEVARMLDEIAATLELRGDSSFRVRAYQEAARTIAYWNEDVARLAAENRLTEIPGVGASIAEKVRDYLAHGHSTYLEELIGQIPPGVFELTRVPGIGPKKANRLFRELHVTSLQDLARAAREHRIREMAGWGEKTEANILHELSRFQERSARLPLMVAWPLADHVAALLREQLDTALVEPAGSIRRRKETIGDIDLLVAATDAETVEQAITALPVFQELIARGPTKIQFLTRDEFQVDVRIVDPAVWGAALLYFTGSKPHSIALRDRAIAMGYKLNEYGLFRVDTGERIAGRTEEEVYHALGLAWIPPELRENTGELQAAEHGRLPTLVRLEDIRGDFHCHSVYSDGRDTLEAMARAAIARGYDWLVMTDHSYSLGVTRGLDEEKAEAQWNAIAELNGAIAPFRLLRGVELEIRASGELDFGDPFLAQFDVVSASIHTGTKQEADRITKRMLDALANPNVDMLNHPSGRIVGARPGYDFDLERVIHGAARYGKALEINGSERLDLRDASARRAKELGAMLSLGSDAHSTGGLDGMRYAVAMARRAWCEASDILNTRSLEQLLAWANRHAAGVRGR